jgi:hypothetical protein
MVGLKLRPRNFGAASALPLIHWMIEGPGRALIAGRGFYSSRAGRLSWRPLSFRLSATTNRRMIASGPKHRRFFAEIGPVTEARQFGGPVRQLATWAFPTAYAYICAAEFAIVCR